MVINMFNYISGRQKETNWIIVVQYNVNWWYIGWWWWWLWPNFGLL